MKSTQQHKFSEVPRADIPRSTFDRSHGLKTTFDSGKLIPIFVDEALPGDTFNLSMSGFGRLATPLHPFMDNLHLETFFFAVPNRLLWNNWEKFNGQQDNPGDTTDFLIPQITTPVGGYENGSIFDYMGVPTNVDIEDINGLPLRAYNLIYNEWFRDENLQDSVTEVISDGPHGAQFWEIKKRGKRHDYFTSCLPWPQKGPDVTLPLGQTAPVYAADDNPLLWVQTDGTAHGMHTLTGTANSDVQADTSVAGSGDMEPNLEADLSLATASTINQLREAFQIQKLYERDARGGTRYTEIIKSHFGVTSPDARLQRPEFLGSGHTYVNINPVAQTSSTSDSQGPVDTPQGNLAAFGTTSFKNHGFTKSFTEHCTIIGLACVRADLTYQQGLNKMWSRQDRFDFYWPALSHLGEQAVLSKEIYADGSPEDQDVFGYQERYAEYRYKPSLITGKMRSNDPQSLDVWHLAQDFENRPVLDSDFIEENPPVDRVIAVQDEPHFIFDSYFDLKCVRPMPTYGVPGLIDHF